MVADYIGHEDNFKNTHPLTMGALEEISSTVHIVRPSFYTTRATTRTMPSVQCRQYIKSCNK